MVRDPLPNLSAKKHSAIKNYLKHGTHSHLRSGSKRWNEEEELNPYLNVIRTFGSFFEAVSMIDLHAAN